MKNLRKGTSSYINNFTIAGSVIALGIVFGDLGTSPLYVMRAILSSDIAVNELFILGALSCIFWTVTLQTTLKYIIITLRADNKGEGGTFSLYALIRRKAKWAAVFAIIGGSTLLADGIITPSITVVSAIEGLNLVNSSIPIIPIVLIIITILFVIQQFGTKFLGKFFGPVMFFWFMMLGILGLSQIVTYPEIFKSVNPYYAYNLLMNFPGGFILLGAVFLCTTGAEALYSDLGHCGLKNIRISWIYVKTCLILNYMGQGAWILTHATSLPPDCNPFFTIMPSWFLFTGIVIATLAAIIASQALISGSYTIISEAILLNFWPKVKIKYPTNIKGQMYIPSINWILYFSCVFVILFFQESSNMEAAYGLSITLTMLMTTALLTIYLRLKKTSIVLVGLLICIFLPIEGAFLIANLNKFMSGGWFTIGMASIICFVMFIWYKGREIKKQFHEFVKIKSYIPIISDLKKDLFVPKYASNLVYLTRADYKADIESKIMYSILKKHPKRADLYWFVHVHVLDEPWTLEYEVEAIAPDTIMRIEFRIGFKVQPQINLLFRNVIEDLSKTKEFNNISPYPSLNKHGIPGDFRFVIIDRIQNYDFNFSVFEQFIMDIYSSLKKLGISDVKAFGLDTSSVTEEYVPYLIEHKRLSLNRIYPKG